MSERSGGLTEAQPLAAPLSDGQAGAVSQTDVRATWPALQEIKQLLEKRRSSQTHGEQPVFPPVFPVGTQPLSRFLLLWFLTIYCCSTSVGIIFSPLPRLRFSVSYRKNSPQRWNLSVALPKVPHFRFPNPNPTPQRFRAAARLCANRATARQSSDS